MVFGNPFMFAILVERVAEWNDSESEDNGHFAFCIRGEVFPKSIINTPYIIALKNALKALKNEPRKEVLMNDWIRETYEIDMIVREMENFICTEELRVHGKKETEEYGTED